MHPIPDDRDAARLDDPEQEAPAPVSARADESLPGQPTDGELLARLEW